MRLLAWMPVVLIAASVRPADAQQPYSVRMEFDVRVRMTDGVELSADVYRPDAAGRFPVILVRTPYDNGVGSNVQRGKFWAARGYAFVIQDVRGRGDSDGDFYPLRDEAADGDATVTWAAAQPWSNGKVGTFGGSYLGWTQGYLAKRNNPALTALGLIVIPPDPWRNIPTQYGAFAPALVPWLALVSGQTMQDLTETDVIPSMHHYPLREADTRLGRVMKVWRDWIDHPTYDDYWKQIGGYQEDLLNVRAPILHVSGWYDDVLVGTTENFINMTTRAADANARRNQWLVLGPWPHGTNCCTELAGIDFGPRALIDYDTLQVRFFDRYLKDKQNGFDADARVKLFIMGANVWRDENEWPLARTQYTRYYLHSGGNANTLEGDGTLSTTQPTNEKPDRYTYDPQKPVPFLGVTSYSQVGTADDYRPVERLDGVLVYSKPELQRDVEVCGPIRTVLYAASSAKDTDFVARLIDVHPSGYAQRLQDGIVRARYRKGTAREEFLTPGSIEQYEIDLWSTCNRFLAGHRIRLEVTSSAVPRFDKNMNTGGRLGYEASGVVAQQTIYHDAQHPSHVLLPIVPAR